MNLQRHILILIAMLQASPICRADELLTDMHYYGRLVSISSAQIEFRVNDEENPRQFPIQRRTQLKFSENYKGPVTVEAANKAPDWSIEIDLGKLQDSIEVQDLSIPAKVGTHEEITVAKAIAGKDGRLSIFDASGKLRWNDRELILVTGKKPTVKQGGNDPRELPANSAFLMQLTGKDSGRKVAFRRARKDKLLFIDDRSQDASVLAGNRDSIQVRIGTARSPSKIETKTLKTITFDDL